MKIVTTADWHWTNNDTYGVIDSAGVNSFLLEKIRVGRVITKYAFNNSSHLIIAGDLLDDRVIDSVTLYCSSGLMKELIELLFVIILEGNHGFDDRENRHAIIAHWKHLLPKHIQIVTYPKIIEKDNISYHCIPAISNVAKHFESIIKDFLKNKKKSKTNILLYHGPILEASLDSGKKSTTGVSSSLFRKISNLYDYIVCGDFHKHQWITKNAWYTGSPLQTTLRDKFQKKGFQVLDTKKDKVKFISIDSFKFIDVEWQYEKIISPIIARPEDYKESIKNSLIFIRFKYKVKDNYKDELELVKFNLLKYGAIKVVIDKTLLDKNKDRLIISKDMDTREMINAFVESKKNSLLTSKQKVVESGLTYLRQKNG